jgi:DNA-binding MurR/RpiR family transcriptional regulator
VQIRIDHYGDEARDARRRVMALASALEGDRDAYMAGLEKEIERVLGQTDPAALTQLIADLADASAVVAFTLGSSLAEEWKVDLDGLFRGVERVLEERKPSNGAAPPSEDA